MIFVFRNIPSEVTTVAINFYGRAKRSFRPYDLGKKKRIIFFIAARRITENFFCKGCAKIELITDKLKDDTFDTHEWVKLRSVKETDLGQCRICIKFIRQKVMPVEEYGSLYEV